MVDAPFSVRFRQARQQQKLTQAKVAKALDVSQSAVAQWESGQSFPAAGTAAKIEKLLGVRYSAVEEEPAGRRPLDKRPRLPVLGVAAPGDDERIRVDGVVRGEVIAPPQLEAVPGAKAVYVRGHSMEPRYYPGEVVYLDPSRPPNPGDFVFLTVREEGFTSPVGYIRQFIGQDLIHIHVLSLNPKREEHIPKENVVALTTIVGSGLF